MADRKCVTCTATPRANVYYSLCSPISYHSQNYSRIIIASLSVGPSSALAIASEICDTQSARVVAIDVSAELFINMQDEKKSSGMNTATGAAFGGVTGGLAGAGTGGGMGALVGAVLGSVVPGPGTALGALIGSGVGAGIGALAGGGAGGGIGTGVGAAIVAASKKK